jgi:SAM-dependent methyltransferase
MEPRPIARLSPGSRVLVRLVKTARPDVVYDADVLADDGRHLVIRAPWAEPEARDLGFVRFEPGDVFTEHYWRDRWYSVKEVRTEDGLLKGWYCDVARPVRIEDRLLVSEDLDLDLWVSADGQTVLRLDEDEYAAGGLAEADPAAATRALDALAELELLAAGGFADIQTSLGTLQEAWEGEARNWIAWARKPGHDSYWRFHRDRFLELLPPPSGLTLDLGCGEGRFPRELRARGYDVIGIDASPTLVAHARESDPDGDYRVADAAEVPLEDASVRLATAFMSLHDMDDMEGAIQEIARVLVPGGRLCAAIVHPINSGGTFESHTPDAPFIIRESYFERRRYADAVERDGLRMTFTSLHRPLEAYFAALESGGFLVERLVEVPDTNDPPGYRWQRLPLFLHLRAVKP